MHFEFYTEVHVMGWIVSIIMDLFANLGTEQGDDNLGYTLLKLEGRPPL